MIFKTKNNNRVITLSALAITTVFAVSLLTAYALEDISTGTAESYIRTTVAGTAIVDPDAVWVLLDDFTVNQTTNSQPTVFVTNVTVRDKKITATVNVTRIADDDFVGFALGYNGGDNTNTSADFLLVDWKGNFEQEHDFANFTLANNCNDNDNDTGLIGTALSRVFGVPDPDEFWVHDRLNGTANVECGEIGFEAGNVTEITRGINNGTDPWDHQVEYTFDFILSGNTILVFLDGELEFNQTDSDFSGIDGNFTFYTFSQPTAVFRVVELMDEGCSSGFWKTDSKAKFGFSSWPAAPLPTDKFQDTFDDIDTLKGKIADKADPTMFDGLNTRGGEHNALAREAVAALLNAQDDSGVNYPLTIQQVIDIVNAALAGDAEDIENARAFLFGLNHAGCPLSHIPT